MSRRAHKAGRTRNLERAPDERKPSHDEARRKEELRQVLKDVEQKPTLDGVAKAVRLLAGLIT